MGWTVLLVFVALLVLSIIYVARSGVLYLQSVQLQPAWSLPLAGFETTLALGSTSSVKRLAIPLAVMSSDYNTTR